MSEYLTGDELWAKLDAAYCHYDKNRSLTPLSELNKTAQQAWHMLAGNLKVPRPKVPTLLETWEAWAADESVSANEAGVEQLRQRLNAAHEARREANS